MPVVRNALIGFVILALCHGVAKADPIQVWVEGGAYGTGLNFQMNQTDNLAGPSGFAGYPNIVGIPPAATNLGSGYTYGAPINASFQLYVRVGPWTPGSPILQAGQEPAVEVFGQIQGSFSLPYSTTGRGTTASLILPQGVSPSDVPPYLADLLQHPDRVIFLGGLLDSDGAFTGELQIAPPVDPNAVVPAPELSMLAITLMGLAGLSIAHRLRNSRRE